MRVRVCSIALLVPFSFLAGQRAAKVETPGDPIRTLIAAFDRFNLIGLGERHQTLEDSQFRLKLIRDPEFARKVNDIVIEFGNPRHQSVLDRYVDGEDVPYAELSKVWLDTTQRASRIWSSPIYEDLITVVRSVNFGLPKEKRLRVLAGDYPMDWSLFDLELARPLPRPEVLKSEWPYPDRDAAAATVIRKEVLDKNRKALVIFGGGHFLRNDPAVVVNLFHDDPRAKWLAIYSIGGPGMPAVIAAHPATPDQPILLAPTGAIGELYAGYLDMDKKGWDKSPNRVKVRQIVDLFLYFGTAPPTHILSPKAPR